MNFDETFSVYRVSYLRMDDKIDSCLFIGQSLAEATKIADEYLHGDGLIKLVEEIGHLVIGDKQLT